MLVRNRPTSSRQCSVYETSGYPTSRMDRGMPQPLGNGDASHNTGTTQRFVDNRPLSSVGQSIAEYEARCQRADTIAVATNSAPTAPHDTQSTYSEPSEREEPNQLGNSAVLLERHSVFVERQHERSEREKGVSIEAVDQSVSEADDGTTDRGATLGGGAAGEVDVGENGDGARFGCPGPLATCGRANAVHFQAGDQDVKGPISRHNAKSKAGPTMDSNSSVAAVARQAFSSIPRSPPRQYLSNPSSPTLSEGSLEERLDFPSFRDLFGQHQVRFDRALAFLGRRARFVASAIKILMTEDNSMSPSASWATCLRSARSVFDAYELSDAELYQMAVEREDPGMYARYRALQLEYPIEDWE